MTAMPEVLAKTRICYALERILNGASDTQLKSYLDKLVNREDYKAWDLIQELDPSEWTPEDRTHVQKRVFGMNGGRRWWGRTAHDVATEGFARAIWMMFHDLENDELRPQRELYPRRRLDVFWSSPSTYVFRVMLMECPGCVRNYPPPRGELRVMMTISTPPMKDRKEHYEAYRQRKGDARLDPQECDVPPNMTQPEPLVIVAPEKHIVRYGRDEQDARVEVVKLRTQLTQAKIRNVVTAQPYCEEFLGG